MANDYRRALIQKYFPKKEWERAYRVMIGESGGRPGAVGDTEPIRGVLAPSVGLFQIRTLPGRPSEKQLKDPEFNVRYAANMQREQGWKPWTVARNLGFTGGGTRVASAAMRKDKKTYSSFTEKANAFRKEARARGWSAKQTESFIDSKATAESARKGFTDVEDITDPSTQLGLREEGIEPKKEAPFKESEIIDRTKEYLGQIDTYGTREEAVADFEIYRPIMEQEGIDTQMILDTINKKFPEKEEEEARMETGGLFGGARSFFERMFSKETREKRPEERTFMEEFFRRPTVFG